MNRGCFGIPQGCRSRAFPCRLDCPSLPPGVGKLVGCSDHSSLQPWLPGRRTYVARRQVQPRSRGQPQTTDGDKLVVEVAACPWVAPPFALQDPNGCRWKDPKFVRWQRWKPGQRKRPVLEGTRQRTLRGGKPRTGCHRALGQNQPGP